MRSIRQIQRIIKRELRQSGLLDKSSSRGGKKKITIYDDGSPGILLKNVLEDIIKDPHISFHLTKHGALLRADWSERITERFLTSILQGKDTPENVISPFCSLSFAEVRKLAVQYDIVLEDTENLGLIENLDAFAPGTRNAAQKAVRKLETALAGKKI